MALRESRLHMTSSHSRDCGLSFSLTDTLDILLEKIRRVCSRSRLTSTEMDVVNPTTENTTKLLIAGRDRQDMI